MENLIRNNIKNLSAYSSARDEFSGSAKVFLDANENPYGDLNRYPDPYQRKLKTRLVELKPVEYENIFIGNGSDEIIDLAFRIFCEPGRDKVLTFSPTYGMYNVSAAINDIELIEESLNDDFQINLDSLEKQIDEPDLKIIFICSPNNPTGNSINLDSIKWILNRFGGIVIIDEAYIDFSTQESLIPLISDSNNKLLIIQTFSKAWGLAAARIGVGYGNPELIGWFNKVKPPYNASALNQDAALNALNDFYGYRANVSAILKQREVLIDALLQLDIVRKIYPSDANFLLIEVDDSLNLYNTLIQQEIVVRNRDSVIQNCLRITIGSPEENEKLIKELKQYETSLIY